MAEAKSKITGEITIGEFVQLYPELVEDLLAQGVHCVGCGAAYYETINQGLSAHGKTEDEINKFLEEINEKAISNEEIKKDDVIITQSVSDKVKTLLKKEGKVGHGLRVSIKKGGCSGFMYTFDFDEKPKVTDKVIMSDGLKVFIDAETLKIIGGSKIEYIETLQESGFKVSNPNAKASCGCGSSFVMDKAES